MTIAAPHFVYFLLVDDLDENLLSLEGLLRRQGLILLKARSGAEALEHLLKHDVALALIDVQMPVMDGFELAELMRGTERTRRVPIIFLTAGSADRQRRFRGYEAGAVDFLQKPIEADILRSKADVFFELYRQRQEVAQQRDELQIATNENARLLEESRRQTAALRDADRRKDEFLAMLAHELRNPLAPVRTAVELLRLIKSDNEHQSNAVDIISRQVSHMVHLIDDLLDVARISRGKVQLQRQPANLAAIVRQTAEDYRTTLDAKRLKLELDLTDEPLIVDADPVRLAQVIGNLLHNAGKFTPEGTIQILLSKDSEQQSAVVSVVDSGIGMSAETLAQIFDPFTQANQSLDRSHGGLGLGLSLARGLMELHGGRIEARSSGLGHGSTFELRLPLAEHLAASNSAKSSGSEPSQATSILIVDDNRDAAQTLQRLLQATGHDVQVVYDGPTALSVMRGFQPRIVISDLGLPGELDGYQVAELVRRHFAGQSIYLVALSGYSQEEVRQRAREAGFNEFLTKPVNLETLQRVLSQAM